MKALLMSIGPHALELRDSWIRVVVIILAKQKTFSGYSETMWVANLDAAENVAQFGTDECTTGVRSVDVKPHRLLVTHEPDLFQVVE